MYRKIYSHANSIRVMMMMMMSVMLDKNALLLDLMRVYVSNDF